MNTSQPVCHHKRLHYTLTESQDAYFVNSALITTPNIYIAGQAMSHMQSRHADTSCKNGAACTCVASRNTKSLKSMMASSHTPDDFLIAAELCFCLHFFNTVLVLL